MNHIGYHVPDTSLRRERHVSICNICNMPDSMLQMTHLRQDMDLQAQLLPQGRLEAKPAVANACCLAHLLWRPVKQTCKCHVCQLLSISCSGVNQVGRGDNFLTRHAEGDLQIYNSSLAFAGPSPRFLLDRRKLEEVSDQDELQTIKWTPSALRPASP